MLDLEVSSAASDADGNFARRIATAENLGTLNRGKEGEFEGREESRRDGWRGTLNGVEEVDERDCISRWKNPKRAVQANSL